MLVISIRRSVKIEKPRACDVVGGGVPVAVGLAWRGHTATDDQHGAGWNLPSILVVLRRELLHVWG